jgi:hypothetical protein
VNQKHFEVGIILILWSSGNLNEIKCIYIWFILYMNPCPHQSRNAENPPIRVLEEYVITLQIKHTE